METKLRKNKIETIRIKLGFANMLMVDSVGRSEGLTLLWEEGCGVELQNFSNQHISAVVHYKILNCIGSSRVFTGIWRLENVRRLGNY
jgi:hypothetical protein